MTVETYPAELPLTSYDLERGRLYLQQTRDYLVGATVNLSGAQWKFKPAPDRWSIAENVEHMVMVQDFVLGPIWAQLAEAPPAPPEQDYRQVDAILINQGPVRLSRFPAPKAMEPAGDLAPDEFLHRLLSGYERLTGLLESTPGLRRHAIPALPLKALSNGVYELMDGYQWLLAVATHNERHTKQILELKASAQFPAGA
jgi:hypothetical protein